MKPFSETNVTYLKSEFHISFPKKGMADVCDHRFFISEWIELRELCNPREELKAAEENSIVVVKPVDFSWILGDDCL